MSLLLKEASGYVPVLLLHKHGDRWAVSFENKYGGLYAPENRLFTSNHSSSRKGKAKWSDYDQFEQFNDDYRNWLMECAKTDGLYSC